MTLLNPLAFYLFSLAAVVILAYFLRHRARPHRVSALFLWQRAAERGRRALRFTRRSPWLLALQLLALTLLVLALADPAYYTWGTSGRLAIIIDGSASMLVSQGGKSRYEAAAEQALELIDSAVGELTVVQAKRHPEVLVPLTSGRDEARALLRSSRPSLEGDASLPEIWQLLKGQAPWSEFQRIIHITDHPVEEAAGLPLETISVGGRARNLGLTSFVVRREPDPAWGYSAFVRAENYADQEERPVLKIIADGEEILSQEIELPPRRSRSLALTFPSLRSRRFTVALEVQDDFPWDDQRYFALTRAERRVLWLGEEDRFLRGALAAAGDFLIVHEPGGEEPDLIVANGTEVPASVKGNVLLVNSSYPPLLKVLGPQRVSSPIKALSHGVLAGVETGDILVAKANRAALPPGGETLWSADGLPLLYLKQWEDQKICYIGFDLWWSNLALTVDWPILMKNLLAWLLPPRNGMSLEAGEPLPLQGTVELTDPQGTTYRPQPGELLIAELLGFYRLDDGRTTDYLAVNLPPEESILESEAKFKGASARGVTRSETTPRAEALGEDSLGRWPRPLWEYLALGGLLALVLELWHYDRVPFWRRRRGQ